MALWNSAIDVRDGLVSSTINLRLSASIKDSPSSDELVTCSATLTKTKTVCMLSFLFLCETETEGQRAAGLSVGFDAMLSGAVGNEVSAEGQIDSSEVGVTVAVGTSEDMAAKKVNPTEEDYMPGRERARLSLIHI